MNLFNFLNQNKIIFKTIWDRVRNKETEAAKNIIKELSYSVFEGSLEDLVVQSFDDNDYWDISINNDTNHIFAFDVRLFISKNKVVEIMFECYEQETYFKLFDINFTEHKSNFEATSYFVYNMDEDKIEDNNHTFDLNNCEDEVLNSLSFPSNPNIDILSSIHNSLKQPIQKYVFVDMDYTLSIPKQRESKLPLKFQDYDSFDLETKIALWGEYFKGCSLDEPIHEMVELIKLIQKDSIIVILTARDYSCLDETKEWLDKHGIIYSDILMRKIGDQNPANQIKLEYLDNSDIDKENIIIFDDDKRNVDLFRENGYKVISHDIKHLK